MIPKRARPVPNPFPYLAAGLLSLGLWGCGKNSAVLVAERAAPVGGEFIRLYGDGNAEYGYAVVKENLKARGNYRYANDTIWFLAEAFKPHFPAGYLPVFGDSLFMESGLHFRIVKNDLD